jgi:CBS domain-containing protein
MPIKPLSCGVMHLAMVARRRPVCIDREATVEEACRLIRAQRVNEVVVTEKSADKAVPAGIISARDIVTRVIAPGLEPSVVTVGDILWARHTAVRLSDSLRETLERLCAAGSEMLPIVDGDGRAAGVVSMEDLLQGLAWGESSRDLPRAHRFHRR